MRALTIAASCFFAMGALAPPVCAAVDLPPARQRDGEPSWMPGAPLPSRPREGRTKLGHVLDPIPPVVKPAMRHALSHENYIYTLPDAPYWRNFGPYYQITIDVDGPGGRKAAVRGPESPESIAP